MTYNKQAGTNELSLQGCTILVTRAAEQSASFRMLLEKRGANVVCCPAIEIADPDSWQACDEAIWKLASYDALCFTSKNGVIKFFERVRSIRPHALETLSTKEIFAVGEKTASALRSSGFTVRTVPHDSTAEQLAHMIAEKIAPKTKILFPTSDIGRDVLSKNLAQFNYSVDTIVVYKTIAPPADSAAMASIQNDNRVIHVATFFSPSGVHNFIELFGTGILKRMAIAVIGPTTAETVVQSGLPVALMAEQATAESLAEGIEKWRIRNSEAKIQ
jgi:uroporphyrinogen III methyltransferase / synthase